MSEGEKIIEQKAKFPSVTVGIPVFNEEKSIQSIIEKFLESDYPNLKEIIICDGGSEDQTREIVETLAKRDDRVKLLDNEKRIQVFALNKLIQAASGEIFLRADGHCIYSSDYISQCVEELTSRDVRNVGGSQRHIADNHVQAGIAFATKSMLGNGGARYKDPNFEGYGDTVFLGCFYTKDLKELGGYDEKNITNEDAELNIRINNKYPNSVFISPKIKVWYSPRNKFSKLFKQYFRYGRGRAITYLKHRNNSPLRGTLPFVLSLFFIAYILFDLILEANLYSIWLISSLVLLNLAEGVRVILVKRKEFVENDWKASDRELSFIKVSLATFLSLIIIQFSHSTGFTFQLIKSLIPGIEPWKIN